MTTPATTPQTELVLDPDLPPKTWELRRATNSALKRCRKSLDADLLTAALDDPKVERVAVGEEAHADLLRIMAEPGTKTPRQLSAEKAAGLNRGRRAKAKTDRVAGGRHPSSDERFHVDRSTLGGFEPEPSGTPGPGGVAS